nr:nuclear transcription factor y subunit b-9 [Quercus suber]
MPIANVIRIMRRILPSHAKISDDAKETIQECVSEYISFITGEANERCQREQRKTVTAEDVLWAMGKLGFDDYVEPLTVYLNRYREAENERNNLRVDQLPYVGFKRSMDYGPVGGPPGPPPYGPGFPMAHHPAMFDASAMGGGYHNGSGAGGSSSSSAGAQNSGLPSFDPYAQFK